MKPLRFYAVAEDWSGNEGENAEQVLDEMIRLLPPVDRQQMELEAKALEAGLSDSTPIMDKMVKKAENTVFSTWEKRPTSGHSLRIAWDHK